MSRVDLEELERCYAYGKPSVLPVGVLFDIIAELKAGRALRAGLVGRLWASDVQALKNAYDKATKGDG